MAEAGQCLIDGRAIVHRYDGVLALDGVDVQVEAASFKAILGANGAGKSTLALILGGMLRPTAGTVRLADPTARICLVPEGRRLFGQLSVLENLTLGGYGAGCSGAENRRRLERVLPRMPQSIRDGLSRPAVTLSGGERQMLALGRALMAEPRVVILDEPSLGLAPILIDQVYAVLDELNQAGVAVVVIEQLATHAASHARYMYLLDRGRIIHQGVASRAAAEEMLRVGYLGETSAVDDLSADPRADATPQTSATPNQH